MAKLTAKKKAKFCKILEATGNISKAAMSIDLSRTAVYKARDNCNAFAKMWHNAFESFVDAAEEEGFRRAFGDEKQLYDEEGKEVTVRTKASDVLLIFMLKGNREKYRDRHVLENDQKNPLSLHIHTAVKPDENK